MRTTLIALLASASIVSASGCARNNIEDLVAETSCGSIDAIANCLGAADLQRLDEIERCYSSNGCGDGAATVEAVWFAKDCQPLDNGRGDLRRRADSTTEDSTTAKTTAKTTSAKSTSAKTSSTTVASTSATTTADSTTSDSTSSTATTASSTTSTSSSTTTTSTGSTTSGATATGTCSVTSTKSTSSCQTTSGTSTCVATTTEIASCAPGMICFSATAGADVCMKRDDELTTSGLIVTIIFGVALAATAIAFGIMCVRNSAKAKQEQQAQLLAAASSKGNDVEAQSFPNRSEANLPLITPGGTRSEETGYYGASQPQQDYFGQSGSGGNSVTPPGNRGGAPQLHQGLGALGGETRY